MAKIKFDLIAVEIDRLINHGLRPEAKALALKHLAAGTAGSEMQKLAALLFGAKKGRQATGPYKWLEIGNDNQELESAGVAYATRIVTLAERYRRSEKHIEACLALYSKGLAASQ